MFPLFESIRILDGQPQNLIWHQKRIDRSFLRLFGRSSNLKVCEVIEIPDEFLHGVVKARLKYNDIDSSISFEYYQKRSIHTLKCVEADDLRYRLKYTDRSGIQFYYDQRDLCNDILLVQKGLITDTSYSNIIFYDGEKWVTPGTPLLEGTQRAKLLYEGSIHSIIIYKSDLKKYKGFQLINAMMPFDHSTIIPINRIVT